MRTATLPSGERVPALGMGTSYMAGDRGMRAEEIASLRLGLDLGLALIDTAETYGDGAVEELVAEAIAGRRDEVFLVSKVHPRNASATGTVAACERSLKRLGTDRIDLYLVHWRGRLPLAESVAALAALRQAGKIRHYGVSNFDVADMAELWSLPGGPACATNQVAYNLARRGIERELLPWCGERGVPVMAHSPLGRAKLLGDAKLKTFAERQGLSAAQVALAWLLAREGVIVIPKSGSRERLKENLGAIERPLTEVQLAELEQLFPPPRRRKALDMVVGLRRGLAEMAQRPQTPRRRAQVDALLDVLRRFQNRVKPWHN